MLDLLPILLLSLACLAIGGIAFVKLRHTVRETRSRVRTLRRLDEIRHLR